MIGTVTFAARRDQFVILAADQLYHDRGRPSFKRRKIVLHPTMPLAVVAAGFESLPVEGGMPVTEHLAEILRGFSGPVSPRLVEVKDAIEARLGPLVHTAWEQTHASLGLGEKAHCEFLIGLFRKGRAHLGRLGMAEEVRFDPVVRDHAGRPRHVNAEYGVRVQQVRDFFGLELNSTRELTERATTVLGEAIRFDETWMEPDARECDGPIDIAIVDCSGARWHEPA